jgi:SAM-dependent methyltransferase
MPPGAKVVLSAGCAGRWYFDWLDSAYPGIERHIGIEAFETHPDDLPPHVDWFSDTVGRMDNVASGSVDLVFSGQNIEHLWPEDVVGFLVESARVLRSDGYLVVDSPNRWMTDALNFMQPEHIMEFTPDEITKLLALAGFADIQVKGVWLCFDRDQQLLLPLSPNRVLAGWTASRRIANSADRPEDCFVWWAEARARPGRQPDADGLTAAVQNIFARAYTHRVTNLSTPNGRMIGRGGSRMVSSDAGEQVILVRGPGVPVRAGSHVARFVLRRGRLNDLAKAVCTIEVCGAVPGGIIASRQLAGADLPTETFTQVDLPFTLDQTVFAVELRVTSTGAAAVTARVLVELVRA